MATTQRQTMESIELRATPAQEHGFHHTLGLQTQTMLNSAEHSLDDALAVLLQAVRHSKNPKAMDSLGTLLAYMEGLEARQLAGRSADKQVSLLNPITLSL